MRAAAYALFCLLGLAPWRIAAAEAPDLRYLLAKLAESLDAGLSRGDLHGLRIEIGAAIRLQTMAGSNPLADLPGFARSLVAVDRAWTLLSSATQCQTEKGVLHAPAECRALVEPMFRTLGLPVPDLTGTPNPGGLIQDLLKELQRQTETTLRAVQ